MGTEKDLGIKYGTVLRYDEKENCLYADSRKVSVYEAFKQMSVHPNQTKENLEALLKMVPAISRWQLEQLLYCCASRFCCSDTTDETPSPFFSVSSSGLRKEQHKELRQLVAWGCLTENEDEKPTDPRLLCMWPSNRYYLDWDFLEQLKRAGNDTLWLSDVNNLDKFEKQIQYNANQERLSIIECGKLEYLDVDQAMKIAIYNTRYSTPENIAAVRNMFEGISEYQFNIVISYFKTREKHQIGQQLIEKVQPFDLDEDKKINEISRLFYYGVLNCTFATPNIRENEYELNKDFVKKIFENDGDKIKVKPDCPIGNIIFPDELKEETLFYNADVLQSLEDIKEYLQNDNYTKLEKHFNKEIGHLCFATLLEGPSGTGKTAFVKDIARCTGRPIIFVDIAKLRGKDYGHDEKMARTIFEEYLFRSCTMPVKPTLFVDECDTLLCSRGNPEGNANSSLINVQNTVLEIWLQELDKFDGILFLTTNNANHMDEAVARRLLFQVHIGHPDAEIQVKLWQHFFPAMSEAEAKEMANTTNFTGGQILKVKEKVKLKEILRGPVPFEELQRLCETNGKIQKRNPVGFGR